MGISISEYSWIDGKFVPGDQAQVPITSHGMQYGTTAFEGIRAYWNGKNLHVFRLEDHLRRLERSCGHYSMSIAYSEKDLTDALLGMCKRNHTREDAYIRVTCFVGQYGLSLDMTGQAPTHAAMYMFPFREYFGSKEISACISSWRKLSNDTIPIQAKMAGNYLNSVVAMTDAKRRGFDEAILLDMQGKVSEAATENVFVIRDNSLYTPPASSSPLLGITRDTILVLCKEMGIKTHLIPLKPEDLYTADEIFLSGTASEIASVIKLDETVIGGGASGPVTERIKAEYYDAVLGSKHNEWLTAVY